MVLLVTGPRRRLLERLDAHPDSYCRLSGGEFGSARWLVENGLAWLDSRRRSAAILPAGKLWLLDHPRRGRPVKGPEGYTEHLGIRLRAQTLEGLEGLARASGFEKVALYVRARLERLVANNAKVLAVNRRAGADRANEDGGPTDA